jgi:two-component system chemotaxis response regulator CheY
MPGLDLVNKGITILVADDYALTRDMIRSILKQLGFQNVIAVEDGKKALERMNSETIDLVICDWNMPLMSGIEVLRAMRVDEKLKSIPFLMLTAEAYKENVFEAAKSGVTEYVSKPFTAQVLADKIANALTRKKPS